nr:nectin-4-like [Procambarus clarkii]
MLHHPLLRLLLLLLLLLQAASSTLVTEEAPLAAVYVVRGETVRLPCNLISEPEDPVILVLWYKNGTKTPVYSVDSRPRGQQKGGQSSRSSDFFRGRADIRKQGGWNWTLVVREAEFRDQGEYRCRLDFQSSPTHNARIFLHVVDLPQQLRIYSPGGALVDGVAVVQEGHPLTLSCRATGGHPLPNVTWWSGPTLLDAEVEERHTGARPSVDTPFDTPYAAPAATPAATAYATNILRLAAVTRAHIAQNITCRAANTPVLAALSASVMLREIDSELRVEMQAPTGKLSGGRHYDMRCEASGVRPPPVLTWWLRGQHLTHNIHVD